MASPESGQGGVRMRRDLNVWEAIGISVALMAPSFALNANPQGMVGAVGRSEAAASLGEETRRPRRDIPRAILGTAIFGGILYIIVTAIEVMGFGTDKAGIDAFASSGALFQTLSSMYLTSWVGDIITLGIVFSAAACALACFVAASRLAYALARDAAPRSSVARLSTHDASPVVALAWVMAAALVVGIFYRLVAGNDGADDPYTLYFYAATAGTIALLVAYAMVTLGAIRFLFLGAARRAAGWEIVMPIGALAVVGNVVYRQMDPDGVGPSSLWNTSIGLIVPAVGILIALLLPGLASNFGRHLSEEEGLGAAAVPAGD